MAAVLTHSPIPIAAVDPSKRLVLVLVGEPDRRAMIAQEYAQRISAREHRCVHLTTAGGRSLGDAAVEVVCHELDRGFEEVVVVIGRLALSRRWQRLLHDRSADAIDRALSVIPGAFPILVNAVTV